MPAAAMADSSGSCSWSGTSGQAVEKGARMDKLRQACERLVSLMTADILKKDLKKEFEGVMLKDSAWSQLKTLTATKFASAAQEAHFEAFHKHGVAELLSHLDASHYGEASLASSEPRPAEMVCVAGQSMEELRRDLNSQKKRMAVEMLRRRLEESESANMEQGHENAKMRAKLQALRDSFERESASYLALMMAPGSRAGA
eukprot:TRINITY_DN64616_c0_g1_i1.p1 TRINITY_DN64616_c0_g1~~TRINITY_DN64616_c0_g1_i1.p1  ORF type:complete len:201 (+),score=44.76 TRINITY_DN64616_c0_g1_i1:19-621(+)